MTMQFEIKEVNGKKSATVTLDDTTTQEVSLECFAGKTTITIDDTTLLPSTFEKMLTGNDRVSLVNSYNNV